MKTVPLKNIEKEYQQFVQEQIGLGKDLSPDLLIELSRLLFESIRAKGIDVKDDEESDMLLFQYGTYNWGGELGKHFSFDITRQFAKANFEEMYQISFTLIFDPEYFQSLESYNSWSSDFESLDEWIENIKKTKGYELAISNSYRTYKLTFTQV